MSSQRIHILIPSHPGALRHSKLASIRLRSAVAFEYLSERGHQLSTGEKIPENVDSVIVGKIGGNDVVARTFSWLDSIDNAKKRGSKIFLDYTDHHLGFNSPMSDFYRSVIDIVDICITPSEHMGINLSGFFSGPVRVIPDPIEVPVRPPKAVKPIQTILWFGHASNISYLIRWLEGLSAHNSFKLICLTDVNGFSLFSNYRVSTKAQVHANFFEWSIRNMIEAAQHADFCVIPSDIVSPRKMGVSSNRLLTALALGLPTAATVLPAYREFSEFFLSLEDNPFSLNVEQLRQLADLVSKAQLLVIPKYSTEQIGKCWVRNLECAL